MNSKTKLAIFLPLALLLIAVAFVILTSVLGNSLERLLIQAEGMAGFSTILNSFGSVELLLFVIALLVFSFFSTIEPFTSVVMTIFVSGFALFIAAPYYISTIQSNVANGMDAWNAANEFSSFFFIIYFICLFNGLIGFFTDQENAATKFAEILGGFSLTVCISIATSLLLTLFTSFIISKMPASIFDVAYIIIILVVIASFICDIINYKSDNSMVNGLDEKLK